MLCELSVYLCAARQEEGSDWRMDSNCVLKPHDSGGGCRIAVGAAAYKHDAVRRDTRCGSDSACDVYAYHSGESKVQGITGNTVQRKERISGCDGRHDADQGACRRSEAGSGKGC